MTQDQAPDAHLPMLTVSQAARLRELTVHHFVVRRGAAPTVSGDAVQLDGRTSPLHSLAQRCRSAPEEHWPAMVEQHFARLEAASRGGESAGELTRQVCLRVLPDNALPAEATATGDGFRYVSPLAEGLVTALALDAPGSVRIMTDGDVARAGLEHLWAAGRARLLDEPVEHEEVRAPSGAVLHSVHGDSHFVASKVLVLPELVRALTGRELPPGGALVVLPTRHLLAFHPIVDGTVVDAVNDLGQYALGAHEDGPGPLSVRLYWWHDGRLDSLTVIDDETRSLSVVPPGELMDLMRGLHGQGATSPAAPADPAAHGAPAAHADRDPAAAPAAAVPVDDAVARLAQHPAAFGDTFRTALAHAHARCAEDPDAGMLETWEAWVTAMQLGSALFDTALARSGTVECRVGGRVLTLPATGPAPYADGRTWLDTFWLGLICRDHARLTRLCQVPLDDLRRVTDADAYLFHWIDTLRSYWLRHDLNEAVVPRLVATMETSHPDVATRTPTHLLNQIDYQPVALFHRLLTRDHAGFAEALSEALVHHESYWKGSGDPRAQVALGPLAMACFAYDGDFPVDAVTPRLPRHLLDRAWYGEFDT